MRSSWIWETIIVIYQGIIYMLYNVKNPACCQGGISICLAFFYIDFSDWPPEESIFL